MNRFLNFKTIVCSYVLNISIVSCMISFSFLPVYSCLAFSWFFVCFQSNYFPVCIFKSMHCFCSLKCENLQKRTATSHAVPFTKMPDLAALQAVFQPRKEPPTRQPPNQSPARWRFVGRWGRPAVATEPWGRNI